MAITLTISDDEVSRSNSGGKAKSLNELSEIEELSVPSGFVVTTEAYRDHMRNIEYDDLDELLQQGSAKEKSSEIRDLILKEDLSEDFVDDILDKYDETFENDLKVAVRSSATTEDSKEASFAGQQETYLNVQRSDLINKIKKCWASMFTERACVYREKKDISHEETEMAVVIQEMVDADVSGVMFTKHPVTGENNMVIESAWGLGEGVVSGEVTPDRFVLDGETGEIVEEEVTTKKQMFQWDGSETSIKDVPSEMRESRTIDEDHSLSLHSIATNVEENYDEPQDVEWAIDEDSIYVLQSRPITTLEDERTDNERSEDPNVKGLGVSSGVESGSIHKAHSEEEADSISEGDILLAEATTPDMVPAMEKSGGLITDKGGLTSHAAIVSRELGVPAVVGTDVATEELQDGDIVTVDADKGVVYEGEITQLQDEPNNKVVDRSRSQTDPITATDVKVNVSLPQMASRASNTSADAVGLLRIEHLVLSLGYTPKQHIEEHSKESFVNELVEGIEEVAEEFYPKEVRVRTLDAPTDEFTKLEGGESEPVEDNPMLGYRGIRRSLNSDITFNCQLEAYKKLKEKGYDNIELMFPLINDEDDVDNIIDRMRSVGIDTEDIDWGVMIETPSSAIRIESIVERPIDFVSFGTNDLTQYTLAVDRNNQRVSDRFDETHEAVLELMRDVVEVCRESEVKCSICGEAASKDKMINELVECGISSVSVNIDSVSRVKRKIKKKEQRMILDDSMD